MKITLKIAILLICSSINAQDKESRITLDNLVKWKTYGEGNVKIKENALQLSEISESSGLFLISPKSYEGDLTISYKAKALTETSVIITLFSVLDSLNATTLTIPKPGLSGSDQWKWRSSLSHYNLTFNNKSHGITPFLFKNISSLEKDFHLKAAKNSMSPNEWYAVKIVKKNNEIIFKLNDTIIFKKEDCNPLKKGHILFRISGGSTTDNTLLAKIMIKDVIILHQ